MYAALRRSCAVLGVSRKRKCVGLLGVVGVAVSGLMAAAPAQAAPAVPLPVVSACTGASLPPSRLTGVVTPLVNGIFTNLDFLGLGGVLGAVGAPTVINNALSGAPIGLDVLTTTGTVLAPGSQCVQQADGFSIATPKGITIGGNSIDGLGATGLNANAGEIGSIALGNSAATEAAATNSIALGTGATVTGTSPNAIAIGNGASATTPGGVALGGGSVDKAPTPIAGVTLNGTAYTFAGATPASVVSVGAAGAERQLANVAAGQISATSTDAVNGSELFATNSALNAIGATANNSVQYDNPGHASVTLGGVGDPTTVALNNVAPAALTPGSTGAVNGGQINTLGTSEATNLGGGSTFDPVSGAVTAPNYLIAGSSYNNVGSALEAITGGSSAAGVKYFHANSTGVDSNPMGHDSVAIGTGAVANNADDVALGANSTTAAAVATPSGVINGTTYAYAGGAPTSVVSVGSVGSERQIQNVGAGQITATSTDAVNGSQLFATNSALNAIGAAASNSVQYDNPGHTSVTLGGVGDTTTVPLNNVAPAALTPGNTGAVNGGQINTLGSSVATNLGGGSTFDPVSGTVTAPSYTVANIGPGVTIGAPITDTTVGGAIGGLSTDVTNLAGGISNGTLGLVQQTGGSPGAGQITVGAATQGTSVTFANSTGATRTLTGVSPGALSPTSTDAVNGSQVSATGTSTANNFGGGSTFDPTTGTVTAPTYTVQGATYNNVGSALGATNGAITATNLTVNSIVTGKAGPFVSDNSVTATQPVSSGANALAGGFGASATGAASAVVGNGATDNGVANSTVVGQGASVVAGVPGSNVALGQGSVVTTGAQAGYTVFGLAPQTSVGDVSVGTAGGGRQISNVAAGSAPSDAVNVAQLTAALVSVSGGAGNSVQYDDLQHTSVTLGGAGTGAAPVALGNVAAGALTPTSTQAVNGSQLYATNTTVNNISNGGAGAFQVYQSGAVVAPVASASQSTAGGDGAVASAVGSTAVGYHATSTGTNSVALGAGSTDGGQANVVSLGAPGAERRLTNVAPGVNGTDGVNLNQLDLLAGAFDNSIQSVIRQEQAGDAVALAASGLRYDDRPGTSSVAGGASYYSGHEGVAFGIGHTSDDGNWRYNIAASFVTPEDHAQVGVIAGVSYTFGH